MTVTTCDAQGKPVPAEVSLACCPRSGREQSWSSVQSFATFFRSRGRATQFQTASSIQFHYQPANRVIGTADPRRCGDRAEESAGRGKAGPASRRRRSDPFGDIGRRATGVRSGSTTRPTIGRAVIAAIRSAVCRQQPGRAAPAAASRRTCGPSKIRRSRDFSADVVRLLESGRHDRARWPRHDLADPAGRCRGLTLVAKAITPDTLTGQVSKDSC